MWVYSSIVTFIVYSYASSQIDAFSPSPSFARATTSSSKLSAIDPSILFPDFLTPDNVQSAFSSVLLSDDFVNAVDASAAADAVDAAGTAAAGSGNGWFGFMAVPIEGLLQLIHTAFVGVGMNGNSWGVSIIVLTVLIKLLTYPLTKTQLESTTKMQMLQPTIKDVQAKYQSNPEIMNQKVSEIYQKNEVNPLAGCVPAIIQLPVFVGLYRAVLNLAKEDKLNEPFLWLPNLEGPTYGADPATANQWITSGWVDGVPSLGWEDTLAFLSIPILLVITQTISQQLMQPKNQTPEQEAQQNNPVIKLLPLLIAWFSVNVPAALGIYWVINNLVTTALTVQIRSSLDSNPPSLGAASGGAASSVMDTPVSTFTPAPMRDKPSGFSSSSSEMSDGVTPITTIDAEVVADMKNDDGDKVQVASSSPSKKKRKGKKNKKKN